MKGINVGALIRLHNAKHLLTKNQYAMLYKQARKDPAGAMKRLQALLLLQGSNAVKHKK